jgi:DNA-binding CsgD family transcriptional regulator
LCYVVSGDLQGVRNALEAVPPTTDNRVNLTFAIAAGTASGAHLGDAALMEKWFGAFESVVESTPEIECGYGLAEILVLRGRRDDAEALLHRVLPDCELLRGEVLTLLAIGRYGAPNDRARSRRYLLRGSEGPFDSLERPALALFDALTYQRDGRFDEAAALAAAAAEGFRRSRAPLLEAAALEIAGDYEAAVALYRACGAVDDVRRLSAGPGAIPLLSTREREVATLAAEGRSNLEIARTLSISHKTVEKHLGSAYQKLGLSSRQELRSYMTANR